MSGLWCVQVGYGNEELAEAGCEALKTLPYYNHFFKTSNPWTIELAARLAALLPDGHDHVLFANSGSEANDSALKLIRYYWNLKRRPQKKIHLSRDLAYHGVTFGARRRCRGSRPCIRNGICRCPVSRKSRRPTGSAPGPRATATSVRTNSGC